MTIEEKARAYDEALKRANTLLLTTKENVSTVEYIFPQLTESEDERIRKELWEYFHELELSSDRDFSPSLTIDHVLAWLEKQKDASKAIEAVDRIDKYIDENVANAHDMKDSNPDKQYYRGWDEALGEMAGILQDVYSEKENKFAPRVLPCSAAWFEDGDEKQKEQKHILKFKVGDKVHLEGDDVNILTITGIEEDRYLTDNSYGPILFGAEDMWEIVEQKPVDYEAELKKCKDNPLYFYDKYVSIKQKPAEWDEYTKTNLDRALQIIKKAKGTLQGYQSDDGIYECDKAIECLEHFLYRGLEIEKPAKWSDEDKTQLTNILIMLKEYLIHHYSKDDVNKSVDWLESLPKRFNLQPKQEWSEEDEKNINSICSYLDSYCRYHEKDGYGVEECKIRKDWLKSLPLNLKKKNEDVAKLYSKEWSEKDEKMFSKIIKHFDWNDCEKFTEKECREAQNWLKSLSLNFNKYVKS